MSMNFESWSLNIATNYLSTSLGNVKEFLIIAWDTIEDALKIIFITLLLLSKSLFPIGFVGYDHKICEAMIELKGELDKSTIIAGDFNTVLSIVDRTGQKIRMDIELMIFHMREKLTYILEILFGLLKTFVNLLVIAWMPFWLQKALTNLLYSGLLKYKHCSQCLLFIHPFNHSINIYWCLS